MKSQDKQIIIDVELAPGERCIVRLAGEIDASTFPEVKAFGKKTPEEGWQEWKRCASTYPEFTLEMGGLQYLDSVGLTLLLHIIKWREGKTREDGSAWPKVVLDGTPAHIRKLLKICQLDGLYTITPVDENQTTE